MTDQLCLGPGPPDPTFALTRPASSRPRPPRTPVAGCTACSRAATTRVEETREYVRDTCRAQGWPLIELLPESPTYEELVLRYGFPGPMGHGMMYRRLKERAVYRLTRDHKERRGDRLGLVAGIRRAESERRRARGEMDVKRAQVWISPLIKWTARERDDYIEQH